MENPIENYWIKRLAEVAERLTENNFDAYVVESSAAAQECVMNTILPDLEFSTIGFGGSMTLKSTGIFDMVCDLPDVELLRSDLPDLSIEEKMEVRRQSLLTDLFFTGTNGVTEDGMLVNLDMIGNRVAALTFGPKHVVVLVGRNKIVSNLETAMARIKDYVAPANAMRLDMKTPCVKTGYCADCSSPARICNSWTITEKSFPKKRTIVVLINEDLGL